MAAPLTTAPTSAPIESRRAQLAALRAQVRARHADRLPSAPAAELPSPVRASQAPRPRIRSSALWDQHCRRLSSDHEEQAQAQLLGSPPAAESDPGVYPTLGPNFIPEEETVRNDYAQNFVDTLCSDLPGGAVRNASLPGRFAEYPKLRRLVEAQQQLVRCHAHPPVYATADLRASLRRLPPPASADAPPPFHLGALLPVKYDVVLIDAPLETYHWEALPTARSVFPQRMPDGENERLRFPEDQFWSWEQLAGLPIPQLAAKERYVPLPPLLAIMQLTNSAQFCLPVGRYRRRRWAGAWPRAPGQVGLPSMRGHCVRVYGERQSASRQLSPRFSDAFQHLVLDTYHPALFDGYTRHSSPVR